MTEVDTDRLKDRRAELDISLGDLAERVGVSYNYLSDVLNGRLGRKGKGANAERVYGPSMRVVYKLSRALELPVDEIVKGGKRTPRGDPSEPPVQPKNEPARPPKRQDKEGERKAPPRDSSMAGAA